MPATKRTKKSTVPRRNTRVRRKKSRVIARKRANGEVVFVVKSASAKNTIKSLGIKAETVENIRKLIGSVEHSISDDDIDRIATTKRAKKKAGRSKIAKRKASKKKTAKKKTAKRKSTKVKALTKKRVSRR